MSWTISLTTLRLTSWTSWTRIRTTSRMPTEVRCRRSRRSYSFWSKRGMMRMEHLWMTRGSLVCRPRLHGSKMRPYYWIASWRSRREKCPSRKMRGGIRPTRLSFYRSLSKSPWNRTSWSRRPARDSINRMRHWKPFLTRTEWMGRNLSLWVDRRVRLRGRALMGLYRESWPSSRAWRLQVKHLKKYRCGSKTKTHSLVRHLKLYWR